MLLGASSTFEDIAAFIRQHEVGRRASVDTPFGRRLLCYADLTATGRYLHFVEAWVRRLRPFYANTHTAVSSTGRLMTELREEARSVVGRSVGAGPDDVVVFTGAGATEAINKLVGVLGLRIDEPLERAYHLRRHIPPEERPLVVVGPYEHHSNELPWRESVAEVVEVGLGPDGTPDLDELADVLAANEHRPLLLGAFSAASNVTGVLTDVHAVARVCHAHGAYALFDYAAAGPYVPIAMHPPGSAHPPGATAASHVPSPGPGDGEGTAPDPAGALDAVFLSLHKFVGGAAASGVLVARRDLFRSRRPERPGGGTVSYVVGGGLEGVDYTRHLAAREEGGTPAIVADVRAGAALLVKELLGPARLRRHEITLARRVVERLSAHPKIHVLGPREAPRLAIISFNIEGLHHDLASALLDHLFGIQNRAGCSCAGPYGHRLLGLSREDSERHRALVRRGIEGAKPGWVRLSVPYYWNEEDLEFALSAVEFVADEGEAFLPMYHLNWATGVWEHVERPAPLVPPLRLTVEDLVESAWSFGAGSHERPLSEEELRLARQRYLAEARARAAALRARWAERPPRFNPPTGDAELDALTWFRFVHASALPGQGDGGHA